MQRAHEPWQFINLFIDASPLRRLKWNARVDRLQLRGELGPPQIGGLSQGQVFLRMLSVRIEGLDYLPRALLIGKRRVELR